MVWYTWPPLREHTREQGNNSSVLSGPISISHSIYITRVTSTSDLERQHCRVANNFHVTSERIFMLGMEMHRNSESAARSEELVGCCFRRHSSAFDVPIKDDIPCAGGQIHERISVVHLDESSYILIPKMEVCSSWYQFVICCCEQVGPTKLQVVG